MQVGACACVIALFVLVSDVPACHLQGGWWNVAVLCLVFESDIPHFWLLNQPVKLHALP